MEIDLIWRKDRIRKEAGGGSSIATLIAVADASRPCCDDRTDGEKEMDRQRVYDRYIKYRMKSTD